MSFEKCPSINTANARFLMTCSSDVTRTPTYGAGTTARDDPGNDRMGAGGTIYACATVPVLVPASAIHGERRKGGY